MKLHTLVGLLNSGFKMRFLLMVLPMWLVLPVRSFAETAAERDLTTLVQKCEREIQAATEPIYRRHREAMDQLLVKATQANDVDAAAKIIAEIKALPVCALLGKANTPKTAEELALFLHGTTWNITDKSPNGKVLYTMTFYKDGTFKQSDGRTGALEFLGPREIKLWKYDPATFNDELNQFRAKGHATIYFGTLKK